MSILFGATCIVGIICMATFIFIGIWLFIIALKAYNQLKYKNYILEKISQSLDTLSKKEYLSIDDINLDENSNENNIDEENENTSSFENIKNADSF